MESEVSKTPLASRKLDQARLFVHLLHAENKKVIGKESLIIEAYLDACLGAIKSALYRLEKEVGTPIYNAALAKWRGELRKLSPLELHRFDRMQKLRNMDVHKEDIKTTIEPKAIPAPHINITGMVAVSGPPGEPLPNPVPGGEPPFAPAWVIGSEVFVDSVEAAAACEKFLALAERFVAEFQK